MVIAQFCFRCEHYVFACIYLERSHRGAGSFKSTRTKRPTLSGSRRPLVLRTAQLPSAATLVSRLGATAVRMLRLLHIIALSLVKTANCLARATFLSCFSLAGRVTATRETGRPTPLYRPSPRLRPRKKRPGGALFLLGQARREPSWVERQMEPPLF